MLKIVCEMKIVHIAEKLKCPFLFQLFSPKGEEGWEYNEPLSKRTEVSKSPQQKAPEAEAR